MKNLKKIALPALMFIFGAAVTLTYVNVTGCSSDEAPAAVDQSLDAAEDSAVEDSAGKDTAAEDTAAEAGDSAVEAEVSPDSADASEEAEVAGGGDTKE